MNNSRPRRSRSFANEDNSDDDGYLPFNPTLRRVSMRSRRSRSSNDDDDDNNNNNNNNNNNSDSDSDSDNDDQETAPSKIMKATLDDGSLSVKSQDKEFYIFLDLKTRYQKEFLERLRDHTLQGTYSVNALPFDEEEQRICAMDFLGKYGVAYWGTPENRERHLEVHKLAETAELASYPECKEEIARAIMILVAKKTKKDWRGLKLKPGLSNESAEEPSKSILPLSTPEVCNPSLATSSVGSEIPFALPEKPTEHERLGSKKKKKKRRRSKSNTAAQPEVDENTLSFHQLNRDIQPFSTILSRTNRESSTESNKKRKVEETESEFEVPASPCVNANISANENENESENVGNFGHDPTTPTHRSPSLYLTPNEIANADKTKFLVSSSNQKAMAPVWVDYQHFESASAFLRAMSNECLTEWDPSAQLNNEMMGPQLPSASVSFEWTPFKIRVRPRKDGDWDKVMRKLGKSWSDTDNCNDQGTQPEEFRIGVTLHV